MTSTIATACCVCCFFCWHPGEHRRKPRKQTIRVHLEASRPWAFRPANPPPFSSTGWATWPRVWATSETGRSDLFIPLTRSFPVRIRTGSLSTSSFRRVSFPVWDVFGQDRKPAKGVSKIVLDEIEVHVLTRHPSMDFWKQNPGAIPSMPVLNSTHPKDVGVSTRLTG